MRKVLLFFFLIFFNSVFMSETYSISELTTKEDFEIQKLREQISLLEKKILQLEEIKAKKRNSHKNNLKIGLALSGGGAKGLAHIGVLRVLEKLNIRPDYISGTSMGAVVGALYSVGYSPDEIEAILTKNDWDSFINGTFIENKVPLEKKIDNKEYMLSIRYDNKFNISLPKGFGNNQMIYFELKKLLSGVENIRDFDKLPIPLRVIATDLNTGEAIAFKNGDLAKAITASIAIPTVFDPIEINGNIYVDGLVSRNFPVIDAFNMGADIVIGSDVGNEIKDKKDYNIITVLNQLVAIQSASSTDDQRKLATILISPDILEYSATDLDKGHELVKLGEKAANEKFEQLKALSSNKSPSIISKTYEKNKDLFIKNITYKNDIDPEDRDIIYSILKNILNREISPEEFETTLLKLYGNDIIKRVYYTIDNDTLVLDPDINPNNSVGVGINYLTGYGTTFNVGTTLSNLGNFGNNTTFNLQVGDYLGASLKGFAYYGYSNKIGIFTNLDYAQNPLFLYDGQTKISDSIVESVNFETGILTQYDNSIIASYGLNTSYSKLKQETGEFPSEDIEYSKNYNGAFLRLAFDNLDSNKHPTNGIKMQFEYSWEGSFDRSNSNFYGPLYTLDGYFPINKKLTLLYGLYGGMISGDEISLDKYIKLGGTKNNIKNRDFSFYGYSYQQKLVEEFLMGKLGLEYKLDTNLYLNFRWNIGTFEDLNDSAYPNKRTIWKDYSQGFDIALIYNSLFGPLEFSLSRDNQKGDILSQISIGYVFE